MNSSTIFSGTVVVDIESSSQTDLEKNEAAIAVVTGGGVAYAARAFELTADDSARLLAILGEDALGDVCEGMLQAEFANVTTLRTASATRASVITRSPRGDRCDTMRPKINHQQAAGRMERLIGSHDSLFISSLAGADLDFVRTAAACCGGDVYFIPTRSQLADARRLYEVTSDIEYLQLNRDELRTLVGFDDDIPFQINALREAEAFKKGVIVTAGTSGIYAFVDGQWHHSRAFDIGVERTVGAGDTAAGTILAALHLGVDDWTSILDCANAASAMHVGGLHRSGGIEELILFREATARLPVRPPSVSFEPVVRRLTTTLSRVGWAATGATTATILLSLGSVFGR